MGIFDRLFGSDTSRVPDNPDDSFAIASAAPEGGGDITRDDIEVQSAEGATGVTQYYFVGNDISENPLEESIIILINHPPTHEWDSAEEWEWGIVKCNKEINVPADKDIRLCVNYESPVVTLEYPFQCNIAGLFYPEEIEHLENPEIIIRSLQFPDELREVTLPEGTRWAADDLKVLNIPFNVDSEL